MGTQVQLKAFHQDRELVARTFEQVERRVHALAAILTDYDPESETRRLSQSAAHHPAPVSDELWEVLEASDRWFRLSGGAFDASLGQLTVLWRKYRRTPRQPTGEEISRALQQTGWQQVQLDARARAVSFSSPDIRLDFGAIGKGYIVDQAFELLVAAGIPCALVNISGNMRAGDAPPDRDGWRIAIAPVEEGGQPLRRVTLVQRSIATSGDLWQYTVIAGVRRSHILDPQTGVGVPGPRCATAIAATATDADALATTACIVGFDGAAKLLAELPGYELLCAQRVGLEPLRTDNNLDDDHPVPDPQATIGPVRVQITAGFPANVPMDVCADVCADVPADVSEDDLLPSGSLHDDRQ